MLNQTVGRLTPVGLKVGLFMDVVSWAGSPWGLICIRFSEELGGYLHKNWSGPLEDFKDNRADSPQGGLSYPKFWGLCLKHSGYWGTPSSLHLKLRVSRLLLAPCLRASQLLV